jgi:hypothetical protein
MMIITINMMTITEYMIMITDCLMMVSEGRRGKTFRGECIAKRWKELKASLKVLPEESKGFAKVLKRLVNDYSFIITWAKLLMGWRPKKMPRPQIFGIGPFKDFALRENNADAKER